MDSEEGYSISQARRWSDVHPEVAAMLRQHESRIVTLEKEDRAQGDKRMEDFKMFHEKLDGVHGRITKLAIGMWAMVATGLGFLAVQFILSVANHTNGVK